MEGPYKSPLLLTILSYEVKVVPFVWHLIHLSSALSWLVLYAPQKFQLNIPQDNSLGNSLYGIHS